MKPAFDSQTFLISANAGPSQIAGEQCSPWFFSSSWQGDQVPQAVGEYMNQKGVKSAFLIAPNYAAGKDVIAGVKANYKGTIVGQEYTRWPRPARLFRRAFQSPGCQARRNFRVLSRRSRHSVYDSIHACRTEATDSVVHRIHR
jgi:hypothetical protein